jgi:hypothetical protein
VFLAEETALALPVESAWGRMLTHLRLDGLEEVSEGAFGEGRELLMQAGIAGVSKNVLVQVLAAYLVDDTLVIPLRWVAAGPSGALFPQLDANLEISAVSAAESVLRLAGAYRPPLGGVGAGLDRLLLHRVANATARRLVRELAADLMAMDEPAVPWSEIAVVRREGLHGPGSPADPPGDRPH